MSALTIERAICRGCGRREIRGPRDRRDDAVLRRMRRRHGGPRAAVCRNWCEGRDVAAFTADQGGEWEAELMRVQASMEQLIAMYGHGTMLDPAVYTAAWGSKA